MEAKTLQALKESIAHWERMRDGTQAEDEEPDGKDCALCGIYSPPELEYGKNCLGCPVYEESGKRSCFGSPFYDAREAWENMEEARLSGFPDETCDKFKVKFKQAAQKMIDYLKSLLPTTEQEGCGE